MSKRERTKFELFRSRLSYIGYRVVLGILARLPLWVLRPLGRAMACLAFAIGGRRRDYMMFNLGLAFPDWSEAVRRRVGRASFVHFTWNLIDVARSTRWDTRELKNHLEIEGMEHLQNALARGKGVILLTLHMGNFEIGIRGVALMDIEFTAVGRPMRNPYIREYVFRERERMGAKMVFQRNVALRIIRALKKGHAVPILNDQYVKRDRGIMAPLFGKRCSTAPGIATLALRSGAAIVPVYVLRKGQTDVHQITFLPALPIRKSENQEESIQAVTDDCNAVLEELIREHPEQWMWSHRRFRYSPDLPDNPYDEVRKGKEVESDEEFS